MILIFSRTVFLYLIVLFVMRFMGKREIGQMQPFELVIAIMMADLASTPMAEIGTPILYGIVPIFVLLFLHIIISLLNIKSNRMREIICGKPRILISKGLIDENALRKENFTINELQERLRTQNVYNISDVEYAILETSGQISIIQKSEKRMTTPEDFNIKPPPAQMAYDLVVDGRVMGDNLQKIKKDRIWLEDKLKKFNLTIKESLLVVFYEDGNFFYQKKMK